MHFCYKKIVVICKVLEHFSTNWIPRNSGLKISAKKKRTKIKWVSDLFISGRRIWDVNLISHLFHPHDADEILNMRIEYLGMAISLRGTMRRTVHFQ